MNKPGTEHVKVKIKWHGPLRSDYVFYRELIKLYSKSGDIYDCIAFFDWGTTKGDFLPTHVWLTEQDALFYTLANNVMFEQP